MKKTLSLFLLALFASISAFAQLAVPVTNAGTTGTTLNSLAIINSSANAVIAGTSNTTVPTYIVVGGAGTSGQAQLGVTGQAFCTMDSTIASAAGWFYVINSASVAGDCHAQSAAPSAGVWVIGYLAASSTTSGSTALVTLNPYAYGGAAGGLPTISAHTVVGNSGGSSATAAGTSLGAQDVSPGTYVAAAGSVNVLTAALSPAVTSYVTGLQVLILPNLANTTTTPTLNLNSLGAKTITKFGTAALAAGDLSTTAVAVLIYDGTEFQLINPQTSAAGLPSIAAHTVLANNTGSTTTASASTLGAQDVSPGSYIAAAGSVNVLTATLSPAVTSYVVGLEVQILPNLANTTTTPTLNLNGLGAKTITKFGTTALAAGDLSTTAIADLVYDGTGFQLANPQTAAAGLPSIAAHTVLGNNSGSTGTAAASILGAQDVSPGSYVAAAGSVNVLTAAFSPAVTSYVTGLEIMVLPNLANTSTTPTINVNGLGAKTITKLGTAALVAGDLSTTAVADLVYDGTGFQLTNPQTSSGGLPSIAAHTFLGNNTGSTATATASTIGAQDTGPSGYATTAGSVNVMTATLSPAITSYVSGLEVSVLPNLANTSTTPTLNLNGLGAVTITKLGTAALAAGDLTTTAIAWLVYDGTEFQLLNPQTTNTTGGLPGLTVWAAGTGTEPALPSNGGGWMAPATGGTSWVGQLPGTITAGFARFAAPATVNGVNASQVTSALINVNDLTGLYVSGGGTAQAQTATLSPAATALTAGIHVYWKPNAANTAAAPTLAVNGLTATAITKCGTTALVANDLITTAIAHAIYDGTQFQLLNPQAAGCGAGGSLPSSSNTQTYYSNSGTGAATSAITVYGSTATSPVGVDDTAPVASFGVGTTEEILGFGMGATIPTFSASCASGATSCSITNGGNINPNGGVVLLGYTDGGSLEFACYSAATSTTITFGGGNCTTGRGYWGSTANTFGSGTHLAGVIRQQPRSASTTPNYVELQDGTHLFNMPASNIPNTNAPNVIFGGAVGFAQGIYVGNQTNTAKITTNGSSGAQIQNGSGAMIATTSISNANILTTAFTTTSASLVSTGIVLGAVGNSTSMHARCVLPWSQATSGTVRFGVQASAAASVLNVTNQDSPGAYTAPVFTAIGTSTAATNVSAADTPSAFGTTYVDYMDIFLTTSGAANPTLTILALTSAGNTITIQVGAGCYWDTM